MKSIRIIGVTAIAASAILTGCASNNTQPYNSGYRDGYAYDNHNRGAYNGYGTIESIQVVQGSGHTSGGGAIIGGLVGALAGNQVGSGSGRTAATVAGGVAGAAIGNNVERNRDANNGQQLYQINVRMENGEYRTITQDSAYDLSVGNRVRVVDGRVYRY
jgi:outer membrane lipoprotein SlyB